VQADLDRLFLATRRKLDPDSSREVGIHSGRFGMAVSDVERLSGAIGGRLARHFGGLSVRLRFPMDNFRMAVISPALRCELEHELSVTKD